MKRRHMVVTVLALAFLISCGGGSSDGSTGDPGKLYVSKLTSGGTEVGTVFADDAGNSIVSMPQTGSDVIKRLMGKFHDGSFMKVEMLNGLPVSATDGTTTATFSNWTATTVDVTITVDGESETVEGVDFSEYVSSTTKGWTEFARATWTTLGVAFCPVSIALAGVSLGAGLPASIVGCSLAASNLYNLLNNQPTLVEQAITYATAPAACVDVIEGTGSISDMESCVDAAGQNAVNNAAWVLESGELASDDGDGGTGDTSVGSCTIADTCTDYALPESQVDQARVACEGAGGVFISGGCPSSGALGSCTVDTGTTDEYVIVYYSPTYTLEIAQQHCNLLGGQWTSS